MYDWIRAGHIICVIAWMAGMLMLPRLMVYRIEGADDPKLVAMMDKACDSLRKIILTPAMALTWLLGLAMIHMNWAFFQTQPWFWAKIFAVILISGAHGFFTSLHNKLKTGKTTIPSRKLRMMNEIPFVLAIIAVVMVVAEPFAN